MRTLLSAALLSAAAAYTVSTWDGSSATAITANADGIFYSKLGAVKAGGLTGAAEACLGASSTFGTVQKGGLDVTNQVLGDATATSKVCLYDFVLLGDGLYDFYTPAGVKGLSVYIDTTVPAATAATAGESVFNGAADITVKVPATMFSDVASGNDLTISCNGGTCPTGWAIGSSSFKAGATLTSTTVATAAGATESVTLKAMDKAGNTNTAVLSIPVRAAAEAPKPIVAATDPARGAVSSAKGGSTFYTKTGAGTKVTVNFGEQMKLVAGLGALFEKQGPTAVAANLVTAETSNPATYGYSFTFTVDATGFTALNVKAGAFVRKSDNAPSQASAAITVTESTALAASATAADHASSFKAAVDQDFFAYLPASLLSGAAGDVEFTTASTAQNGAGLYFVPGKLGRAAIAGKLNTVPASITDADCNGSANTWVVFTVTAKDAAGNSVNTKFCVEGVAKVATSTLALASSTLSLTETSAATATAVDSGIVLTTNVVAGSLTDGTKKGSITAYLETPDSASATEKLALGGTEATGGAYALVSASAYLFKVVSNYAALADAATVLNGLTYVNTNEGATSSDAINKRGVRVVIADMNGVVMATGFRPLSYTAENDAPSFTTLTAATGWTAPATGSANTYVKLMSAFVVADSDDLATGFRSASITITDKCDSTRDKLVATVATGITSAWFATKCQLVISPAAGATLISQTDLQNALKGVQFETLDITNPNNWDVDAATASAGVGSARALKYKVAVTDNASNGKLASPATTTSAEQTFTVTSTAQKPTFVAAKAYAADGIFGTTDVFANSKTVGDVTFNKPVIVAATGVTSYTFKFNFNKVSDGVYALGALTYSDRKTRTLPSISAAKVSGPAVTVAAALVADTSTSPQLLTLAITGIDNTKTGEVKATLTVDGTAMDFYFDIRKPACKFNGFTASSDYPSTSECSSTTEAKISSTYTAGGDSISKPNAAAFTPAAADKATKAALDTWRAAQKGFYSFSYPANAVAAATGFTIAAAPLTTAQQNNLPVHPVGTVDSASAISFGPAGTTFSKPATVCILVGNVASGFKPALAVSSQIDVNDASKGYGAWETLAAQTYDPVTSKVCGELTHFSIVAPVLVPAPTSATAQKSFQMGASCPNSCSGRGYCRELGQCFCFEGFTGYDCSQRTCPADESWDVPADGSVAHKPAECSGRGACDRKTGTCACYAGFEGAACNRVACPNDCSGHGKCRLASELSAVGTYTAWEADRVQVCVCDAGYTGNDCSQRACAFGDDPESVCLDDKRQIQRISIDFGTLPSGVTAASAAFTDLYDNDELTLTFTAKDGHSYSTPTVGGIWDADSTAATALANALKSLPSFAVSDVSVSPSISANKAKVDYDVTFTGASLLFNMLGGAAFPAIAATTVADNTVSGNQALLACDAVGAYITGCKGDGCRPAHKQPRLLDTQYTGSVFASVHEDSVLTQDAQYKGSNGVVYDFSTAGVWGVSVTITVTSDGYGSNNKKSDGTLGLSSYRYDVSVYGQSVYSSPEMPLPPDDLRANVPITRGLFVAMNTGAIPAGTSTMTVSWRLPTCQVSQVQAADKDYESYECSNRGVCDRKSGQCQCFAGYAGYNCGQQTIIV